MRKLLLLLCLVLFSSFSVHAITADDLTALAAYYSEEVLFFGAIRTDEDYLAQLDALLQQAATTLNPDDEAPSFVQLLDALTNDLANTTFEDGVRPWLGNTLALGMAIDTEQLMETGEFPGFIAASVTDKAAALKTIDAVLKQNNLTRSYDISRRGAFTLYTADFSGDPSFAVGDDVLFFGTDVSAFPFNPVKTPLAESVDFVESLAQLPESTYNALIYVNAPALMEMNAAVSEMMGQTTAPALAAFNNLTNSQVWGFTILDDTTLVVDIATRTDLAGLADLGLNTVIPNAVDVDFAQRIPVDAAFVMHSSDFGAVTQSGLDNIRAFGDYIAQNGGFANLLGLPEGTFRREEEAALNLITPGSLLAIFNVSFAGLTGLSLERDVLPVLDGDAALYLRLLPTPRRFPLPTPFLPDMALLFQSSDTEGARMVLDALIAASEAYDTGYAIEAYGDEGAALVAPLLSQALRADATMLDFMVAADGDLFALGTRPAVESAVNADQNLTDTPEFKAASAYFLPGSQNVGYVTFAPIGNLIAKSIRENALPRNSLRDVGDFLRVAGLIESATFSTVVQADGLGIARLTLTLYADRPSFMPEN
jgi:hypothetical protein